MSRLIVKNLPRNFNERRLRELFEPHGTLTQVKLLPKRRFAYVGYKDEKGAEAATKYLNQTFVDTSKIEVGAALAYGAKELPRPWSKFSEGSSAYKVRRAERLARARNPQPGSNPEERKAAAAAAGGASVAAGEDGEPRSVRRAIKAARKEAAAAMAAAEAGKVLTDEQRKLAELARLQASDQSFIEFFEVMKGKKGRTWTNDGATGAAPSKKSGGVAAEAAADDPKEKVAFADSDSEGEDDYQMLSAKAAVPAADGDEDDDEAAAESGERLATNASVSDMDWLRSKKVAVVAAGDAEQGDSDDGSDDLEDLEDASVTADSASDDGDSDGDTEEKKKMKKKTTKKAAVPTMPDVVVPEGRLTVRLRGLPFSVTEEQIEAFFSPLVPEDIRLINDVKGRPSGRAFVDFATTADVSAALKRNNEEINKRYIEVSMDDPNERDLKEAEKTVRANGGKIGARKYPAADITDETLIDTGRIFVRNLAYSCTDGDLRTLFERFGPVTEVTIPVDNVTKQSKAFGFVTFVLPEHAVTAFAELDGTIFQGRLLHLIPAKEKNADTGVAAAGGDDGSAAGGVPWKKKKLEQQKNSQGNPFNWNTLFLRADTVADAMASSYGVSKTEMLDKDSEGSLAVRLALGETHIVAENKEFLAKNGVCLDAFDTRVTERSTTCILVKNTPFDISELEMRALFSKFGSLGRVVIPPSHTIVLVEFTEPSDAKKAFNGLAYRKFKSGLLYLEWAPLNVFTSSAEKAKAAKTAAAAAAAAAAPAKEGKKQADGSDDDSDEETDAADDQEAEEDAQSTLFVKNLNFDTTEDALKAVFIPFGHVRSVKIATKTNPREPTKRLSMGFAFVEFAKREAATKALRAVDGTELEGHKLELKMSHRASAASQPRERGTVVKAGPGTKLIVRNVAFETTKKELRELFSAFGQIKSVRIPRKFDGTHRGFAFVDFLTRQEAKNAYEALGGSTHMYGRRLVLEWAEDDTSVDAIREKTSHKFEQLESAGPNKRRKLNPNAVEEFLS